MEFYLFPMDGKVLFIVVIFAIYLSPELYGGRFFVFVLVVGDAFCRGKGERICWSY